MSDKKHRMQKARAALYSACDAWSQAGSVDECIEAMERLIGAVVEDEQARSVKSERVPYAPPQDSEGEVAA